MATLKDTLKNSKSVKNSDEILDELFSSIKVCIYLLMCSTLYFLYVDSFRRRRVPLEMRVKLQKVKLKNPVMKKKTGKNIKRVKRKRRSTRRKRKSINVVMIIVMRMRSLQRK